MDYDFKLIGIEQGRDIGGPVAKVTFSVAANADPRVVWTLPVLVQDLGDEDRNEASARMALIVQLGQVAESLKDTSKTWDKLFPSEG